MSWILFRILDKKLTKNFSWGPRSKYFRFYVPCVSVTTAQFCHCRIKAAKTNRWMWKMLGWIWPLGYSLQTSGLANIKNNFNLTSKFCLCSLQFAPSYCFFFLNIVSEECRHLPSYRLWEVLKKRVLWIKAKLRNWTRNVLYSPCPCMTDI